MIYAKRESEELKMKMKKTFAAMLAGVMCVGMMAGCGSQNGTEGSATTGIAESEGYEGTMTL